MNKRKVIGFTAAALAVAGGSGAIAATKDWSPRAESQAVINDTAQQLGVDPSKLTDALKKALANRVDAAVAAGRLTKEQGDALKQRIQQGQVPLIETPGFEHHGQRGFFGDLDAAASYLGLTEDALRTELESGKTLAQVAQDKNKSVDGLVATLNGEAKKKLDAAVAAGRITQAEADQAAADLKQRITDLVNGTGIRAPRAHNGFGFRHGDGPPPGFAGPI